MEKLTYEFTRVQGKGGFFERNRASTDAVAVLENWKQRKTNHDRSFEIILDEDAKLIAEIEYDTADGSVGQDLNQLCQKFRIDRLFVSQANNQTKNE
jgi:hypothetical protein